MMTLKEAIKHAEEVAHQKDLESGLDTDNEQYAMTDEERADCKKCADEHRQLAEWLKDYGRLLERRPVEDYVSREQVEFMITGGKYANENYEQFIDRLVKELKNLPPVTPVSEWVYGVGEFSSISKLIYCLNVNNIKRERIISIAADNGRFYLIYKEPSPYR